MVLRRVEFPEKLILQHFLVTKKLRHIASLLLFLFRPSPFHLSFSLTFSTFFAISVPPLYVQEPPRYTYSHILAHTQLTQFARSTHTVVGPERTRVALAYSRGGTSVQNGQNRIKRAGK